MAAAGEESDIELNHYHDPRVAELADIVIPARHRGAIACRSSMQWIASVPLCANRSEKDCRRRGNQLARAGNMLDKQNPMCQQIADNVVRSCCRKWRMGVFRRNFCRCKWRGQYQ